METVIKAVPTNTKKSEQPKSVQTQGFGNRSRETLLPWEEREKRLLNGMGSDVRKKERYNTFKAAIRHMYMTKKLPIHGERIFDLTIVALRNLTIIPTSYVFKCYQVASMEGDREYLCEDREILKEYRSIKLEEKKKFEKNRHLKAVGCNPDGSTLLIEDPQSKPVSKEEAEDFFAELAKKSQEKHGFNWRGHKKEEFVVIEKRCPRCDSRLMTNEKILRCTWFECDYQQEVYG